MDSLRREECGKCGAVWLNGQLRWGTGKEGKEEDLAGLVCNNLGDHQCINPKRGIESGQTWEYRRGVIEGMIAGSKATLTRLGKNTDGLL